MSQTLSDRMVVELNHQIAYAERQFVYYQLRVQLNIAMGKHDVAKRFLNMMEETNDFINEKRRLLEPGIERG